MNSKKRAFISVGTAFAMLGVALGVAALATVMSVTGGFQEQFREKVLGVNAHVLVLKYSTDFREYRDVMEKVERSPGVIGVGPFIINPMMVSHGDKTATGVLLEGRRPRAMAQGARPAAAHRRGSLEGMRSRRGAALPPRSGRRTPGLIPLPPGPSGSSLDRDCRLDRRHRPSTAEDSLRDGRRPQYRDSCARSPTTGQGGRSRGRGPRAGRSRPQRTARRLHRREPTRLLARRRSRATRPAVRSSPRAATRASCPTTTCFPTTSIPIRARAPTQVAQDARHRHRQHRSRRRLGVGIGDCVQVTSPTIGMHLRRGGAIRPPIAKQFRVIAIFEAGFDQYDSKLVYTDLYEAQAFYDQGDSVTGVEMKVDDIEHAARRSRKNIDKMLANGALPHDGLGRAQPRPLHRAPHPADRR